MRKKYYVGVKDTKYEVFKSANDPTQDSHGHLYSAVIGAFWSKRGADYMAKYGRNNPHLQTVGQAERAALVAQGQTE